MQRPSSDASKPEQRIWHPSALGGLPPPLMSSFLPCDDGNTGMRWPFAAWELAGSGRSCAAAAEDDAHTERTCREEVGTCAAPALDEAAEAR